MLLQPKSNSNILSLGTVENNELNLQDLTQFSDDILHKMELDIPDLYDDPPTLIDTSIEFIITPKNVKNKEEYTIKSGTAFGFLADANDTTGYSWAYSIDPEGTCGGPKSIEVILNSY